MTQLAPYIDVFAYIPLEMLGGSVRDHRRALTIRPKSFDGVPANPIITYDDKVPGYFGFPIDYALVNFEGIDYEDRTVIGAESYYRKLPDPNDPRAAPGQAQFMADMLKAAQDYFTVLAIAPTGSGKTVTSLNTAAILGRRTLTIVPTTNLLDQWIERINQHLGVPVDDIGLIQGKKCDYEHPFVVTILKSFVERDYGREVYDSFGTVIFDEAHRLGAETFSQAIRKLRSRVKIAMTATDRRKDGTEPVFHNYFGRPVVISQQRVAPLRVLVMPWNCNLPSWAKLPGHIAKLLSEDFGRNAMLADIIGDIYFNRGADMLVLSDRVEQLQVLMGMVLRHGANPEDLGLYVRAYTDERGRKVTVKKEELKQIEQRAKVVFATYGMFKEGADIPRLSVGLDATPRADAEQAVGRVRRPFPGKSIARWFTIHDRGHRKLEGYFQARMREYQKLGADIQRYD